ncbi:MAG: ATP-binding protein [Deltaproteobacteria bacterium]|nr:ATP-binding protein [Deltaproteobacteria bacterium]
MRWTLIFMLITLVSFLHYFTGTEHSNHHGIYRRLYYLPIILSGSWFGIRGGVFSSLIISIIYAPHILIQWEHNSAVRLEQTLEILLYNVIGLLTGFLSSKINFQRLRAESNSRRLSESYTKLKEQADMIVEIEDQLRQADRLAALGELSAGMAHEIRNPLGSIRGAAEILNDSLPEEQRNGEFSKILISEVDRLNQVVENYLNFARPEQNQQTEFKPDEVLSDVIRLTHQQAVKSRINIHWEKTSLPLAVGDTVQFKQVFLNLILNALQAMQQDGDLWIETSFSEDEIVLSFRDSGPGIPTENLAEVFDPFFTTKSDGTGLGLAITYRILQSHSGKISVRNSLTGGAEFIVTLKPAV